MNTINDRIQYIANHRFDRNISALSRAIGIPQTTLANIVGERKSKPNYEVLAAIINSNELNISPKWLLTGYGEMYQQNHISIERNTITLPLIPYAAAAGFLSSDTPPVRLEDCEQYVIADFVSRGAEYLIRVTGDSMSPRYHNGDILAIKQVDSSSFLQWGKVYVLDTTQGLVVKRLLPGPSPDTLTCRSEDSTNYPDYTVAKPDIRGLAIVIGAIKIE